jgi:hypothetical protein
MDINAPSKEIIGAAMRVHRALGPGLLEGAYEACLAHELATRELAFERQRPIPLTYGGEVIEVGLQLGLLINFNVTSLQQGIRRVVLGLPE